MEQLHIPKPMGQKLDFIAKEMGMSEEACAQEAIQRFIEDYEDARDAEQIAADPSLKIYTSQEVWNFINRPK